MEDMKTINKFIIFSFLTGFSVMVVELTATRVISPIVGNSIYTWTTIIGTVLLGGALGNHYGGRWADKRQDSFPAAALFLASGILVMFVPLLADNVQKVVSLVSLLWLAVLEISFLLFLLPSFLLGMIYPMLFKRYMTAVETVGREVGTFAASWSAGSIAGTFLTGFFFIGYLGTKNTLLSISALLFVASFSFFDKTARYKASFVYLMAASVYFFLSNALITQAAVYEGESDYYKIKVVDSTRPLDGKVRTLYLDADSHSIESASGNQLDIYTGLAPAFSAFNGNIKDVMVIGGGSLELSANFKKNFPDSNVTTLEIDKQVTQVADRYFNISDYIIRNTVEADGRAYLAKGDRKYDVIFSDAYNSYISVPWHLSTREFFAEAKRKLNLGGVFAVNFISAKEGKSAGFYQSMLKTFTQVFDNYYVFSYGNSVLDIQNIVLVGLDCPQRISVEDMRARLGKLSKEVNLTAHYNAENISPKEDAILLTDDFAPTDRLMMPIMDSYFAKNSKAYRRNKKSW